MTQKIRKYLTKNNWLINYIIINNNIIIYIFQCSKEIICNKIYIYIDNFGLKIWNSKRTQVTTMYILVLIYIFGIFTMPIRKRFIIIIILVISRENLTVSKSPELSRTVFYKYSTV